MPEGDTIFRSARTLNRALAGKAITGFKTVYANLASANDNFSITGRTVERVEARGKWLLMYFSGDLVLLTHMLMNGSWHIYRPGERWKRQYRDMRIVIETADWIAVGFTIPVAELHSSASLVRRVTGIALGPDLLKEDFDPDNVLLRIRERAGEEIAVVLLNQHVLAGVGNVFKSEICFACGIHPFQRVETLTDAQLEKVVAISRKFLKANVVEDAEVGMNVDTSARKTTNFLDPSAKLWVYGRRGEPCRRCGIAILMRRQGAEARTSFWCPECQPLAADARSPGSIPEFEGWSHRRRGTSLR